MVFVNLQILKFPFSTFSNFQILLPHLQILKFLSPHFQITKSSIFQILLPHFQITKSSNSQPKMSQNISTVMQQAQEAFEQYRKVSGKNRAIFLETIAEEIESLKDALVGIAHQESNLPLGRLQGEIGRTTGQLRMFARLVAEGSWVEACIDLANPDRVPQNPTLVKCLCQLAQ